METFYIKRGDRLPAIEATLTNPDGTVPNLTGATVKFRMYPVGSDDEKVDGDAQVVSPSGGVVKYSWAASDTDTAGEFNAEFEVTFPGGLVETFPNYDYIKVQIYPDLK